MSLSRPFPALALPRLRRAGRHQGVMSLSRPFPALVLRAE